jgi:inorganic triphosphatase YgiF
MQQDTNFMQDMQELIKTKQKQSAFVYVRNHLDIIEKALHEGAQIADVCELLHKNEVNITLPTLRLYLHRLRKKNNTAKVADTSKTIPANVYSNIDVNNIDANNNASKIAQNYSSIQSNLQSIKQQIPNLEELSKAFKS